jgi:predicted esterase
LVSPWGRGNLWYRGIAETDIWEGMAAVKALVRVNESRQYLCGHSMGGYGAWHIALRSAGTWAALGIHAGALQYDTSELDASAASALRDLPTYFVVGTRDGLLNANRAAYTLLQSLGNPNLAFVTFSGAHDYRQTDVEAMYLWLREFESRADSR